MIDFTKLPVKWIDIRDCTWPEHDINPRDLEEPERRREIDDTPISVELLVSGHWFIHDGRHRVLRARARGEYQIQGYTLTHSNREVLEEAKVAERMCPCCNCTMTYEQAVRDIMRHQLWNRDQSEAYLDALTPEGRLP